MSTDQFQESLSIVMGHLDATDRRALNDIARLAEAEGLTMPEALDLSSSDPSSLSPALYWAIAYADDLDVFQRVISMYE